MNDARRSDPIIEAWLKGTSDSPHDTGSGLSRVMARVGRTRQRGRWWPLPSLKSATVRRSTEDRSEPPADSVPTTIPHSSDIFGRTHSMFSPVKAIAAGAIIFAIGGVLLVAEPGGQPGQEPSGASDAEAAPQHPTEFSGTFLCGPAVEPGTSEVDQLGDGFVRSGNRGNSYRLAVSEISDPRLEGRYTQSYDEDVYFFEGMAGEAPSVGSSTWRIENEEGAWQGSTHTFSLSDGTSSSPVTALVGEGAYDGLVAIWEAVWDPDAAPSGSTRCGWHVRGLIIDGELPAVPQ